jgi:diguanylate cyclase (GGDEF)-like protein
VNSRNQILFAVFAVLLLAGILLMQFEKLSRNKLEQEKQTSRTFRAMANTDSMTGVRNKLAYSEHEAAINQRIQDNAIEKLAVVVCDINGLKYVNDNDGHAAGDALIKDACALICGSFTHGAVFRIGGDEFVVLLEGEGFDTMDETVRALNRKVEDNIRENAVVVSVGCAVLRKEDRQLRDVFERADQMMYERKKALKEMGAHTRLP